MTIIIWENYNIFVLNIHQPIPVDVRKSYDVNEV